MEAAAKSCGENVTGACCVDNLSTRWWIPVMKEAIKLKKEAFWAWLAGGGLMKQQMGARKVAALMVTEEKPGCGTTLGRPWRRSFGWLSSS